MKINLANTATLHNATLNRLAIASIAMALTACGSSSTPSDTIQTASAQTLSATNADLELPLRPDRIPLIVGGSVVNDNRYPWMAALVDSGEPDASTGQFCGGSLIAPDWVLTAAHCVEDVNAAGANVLLGQRNLTDNNGERIAVERIIVHPDYNAQGYPDIALMQLADASAAPVISLPSFNNPAPNDGEISTVTGWGQVSENGPATNELRESSMPVVDHSTCNSAYNNEINRTAMVCAGTPSGDKDSCYGDSGGPLFVKRNNEFVQAGVVSFGEACGLAGVPGVYARVSSYYDWISSYATVKAYSSGNSTTPITQDNSQNPVTDNGNIEDPIITTETDETEIPEAPIDNTNPTAENSWQFNGTITDSYDEVYLPADEGTIEMSDGYLTVQLTTQALDPMVVFIDEYDPDYDEWFTVTAEMTRNGSVELEIDLTAGEYAFSVLSLGDGGEFSLNASLGQ